MSSNKDLKNVVVIGAASAGVQLATNLAKTLPSTHRVVLIEANPVAYWSIGALRAAVQPGFETKIIHDLNEATVFGPSDTQHVVLAGTRVIDLQPDHIIVDRDITKSLPGSSLVEGEQGKSKIPVDKVALAVGAEYTFPSRINPKSSTREDVINEFNKMQKQVEEAQEILVVGGGPTGVEFVGEVLDQYPNKCVTLITRASGLVTNGHDAFGGLSNKLLSQLKNLGARIILEDGVDLEGITTTGPLGENRTFTTEKGEKINADFVLVGSGGKPNTEWISAIDPSIVDPATKLLKVDPFFKIDPSSPSSSSKWDRYYAMGDAASTPGPKTSFMASNHAPILAHNISVATKGEPDSKLKKAPGPPGNIIVVPLGKSGGASHLMLFSVGGWITSLVKGKTLFVSQFEGWFKK